MKNSCFIGIDIGHTNCKAIAVTPSGKVLAKSVSPIPIISSCSGQYEQSPNIVWASVINVVSSVVDRLKRDNNPTILAISIGSYRGALMLIDSSNKPVTNILTRLDSRDTNCLQKFANYYNLHNIYDITGQPCENYTLTKLMWVQENFPKIFEKGKRIITSPKDYLLFRITGEHITNETMAQSTLMYNQKDKKWDPALIKYAGISNSALPCVLDALTYIGTTGMEFESLTGLPSSTPLVMGSCDGVHSNLGVGAVKEGTAAVSLGSFVAVRCISERVLSTGHSFDRKIIPDLGVMTTLVRKNGGRVLSWVQTTLSEHRSINELDTLVSTLPRKWSGLISIPNFFGPVLASGSKDDMALFVGLRESDTAVSILKSIYEGISFGIKSSIQTFENDSYKISELFVGGGGANSIVWPQIISDITGITLNIPKETESSAIGASICAAVGSSYFDNLNEAATNIVQMADKVHPNFHTCREYKRIFDLVTNINVCFTSHYTKIHSLRNNMEQ